MSVLEPRNGRLAYMHYFCQLILSAASFLSELSGLPTAFTALASRMDFLLRLDADSVFILS